LIALPPILDSEANGRLLAGLAKIALVLRHQNWAEAGEHALTPTQGQILSLLLARSTQQVGVSLIAEELALTKATVSDSVSALVRKGLVLKTPSNQDRRAVGLRLTKMGERAAESAAGWPDFLAEAASELSPAERAVFLFCLTKMIRRLQERGLIPVARMCVTCRFFQPNAYTDPANPHHCDFVDLPFGNASLRIDCGDHEIAEAGRRAELWRAFRSETPTGTA